MQSLTKILIFFLLFTLTTPIFSGSAKVYLSRNEQGVLVFSDTPMPGAIETQVVDTNSVKFPADTSILNIPPTALADNYQINITQPTHQATIHDNTGSIYIAGKVEPVFKRGFTIQLHLDNRPYKKSQSHTMFLLQNIDRGEHKIKMSLLNNKGKVIATSSSVTFYMHRMSVNRAN